MAADKTPRVLITGFGPFLDIKENPSFTITTSLPPTLPNIHLIAHPTPVEVSYHSIFTLIPKLLEEHKPDIILHIGLAVERDYFAIEKSAAKDGYHDVPDVKRRVFTRAENRKAWGKGPERLGCALDLERVVERWEEGVRGLGGKGGGKEKRTKGKGKEKEKKGEVSVRLSDDVGNFVCGFVYYLSLLERERRGESRDVVFFHVPPLEGREEMEMGVKVTERLIEALVNVWREERA